MHPRRVMDELLPAATVLARDLFDRGRTGDAELVRLLVYVIETMLAPAPAKVDETRTERYLSE